MYVIQHIRAKLFNNEELKKSLKNQDLRIRKTKQAIHRSLLIILKSKPLSHIKVTELCKHANINRGTFYFHYDEVGAVFEELFHEVTQDLQRSYNEPYKKGFGNQTQTLEPQMIEIFRHVKQYEHFYNVVLSEDVPMKYYYMLYDEIKALMKVNVPDMDDFFHSYSANGIIGVLIEWHREQFRQSIEQMNEKLVAIVQFRLQ